MPYRTSAGPLSLWPHWLLLAWVAVGCRGRAEQTIKDSEGRRFLSQCSSDRICSLSPMAGPEASDAIDSKSAKATQAAKLRATGRVVGICGPAAAGTEPAISDCRPVVCEGAADCPNAEGLNQGVCISGLCTEPSHPINADDSVMLCLAGTGFGQRTAEQVERLALGLNCGTPCRIPKPCRQP